VLSAPYCLGAAGPEWVSQCRGVEIAGSNTGRLNSDLSSNQWSCSVFMIVQRTLSILSANGNPHSEPLTSTLWTMLVLVPCWYSVGVVLVFEHRSFVSLVPPVLEYRLDVPVDAAFLFKTSKRGPARMERLHKFVC
jgi:hypothetical protein